MQIFFVSKISILYLTIKFSYTGILDPNFNFEKFKLENRILLFDSKKSRFKISVTKFWPTKFSSKIPDSTIFNLEFSKHKIPRLQKTPQNPKSNKFQPIKQSHHHFQAMWLSLTSLLLHYYSLQQRPCRNVLTAKFLFSKTRRVPSSAPIHIAFYNARKDGTLHDWHSLSGVFGEATKTVALLNGFA
jgi:hypothetical protein